MKIPFVKMHGAGNDFIVVDDRSLTFPVSDTDFLQQISRRCTGIGSDGVILIQPSECAAVRMRFINPDGAEQDMCGNGARCFARRVFDLGVTSCTMSIETQAGVIQAQVQPAAVCLQLTDPTDWRMGLDVGCDRLVDFVNSGVPHTVVREDDLSLLDIQEKGRALRFHDLFAPEGANANFVQVEPDGTLSVRTYERGVEGETLACGTGATAAALIAERNGWIKLPVAVHCAGGYDLVIDSDDKGPSLTGPAEYVFEGEVEYGNRI